MRRVALGIVLAILVVAIIGIGYLPGSSARGTQTITSTTTSTLTVTAPFVPGAKATAADSNGSTGVDLVLAVNATTLKAGQTLNVQVSLQHTPGDKLGARRQGMALQDLDASACHQIGVSKKNVAKLNEVTGFPVPVVMEALRRLKSRGLVASASDGFEIIYHLTEKGYKLVQRL